MRKKINLRKHTGNRVQFTNKQKSRRLSPMTEIWEPREADLSPSPYLLSTGRCEILKFHWQHWMSPPESGIRLLVAELSSGEVLVSSSARPLMVHMEMLRPREAERAVAGFRGRNRLWFLSDSTSLLLPPRIHGFRPIVTPETLSRLSLGKARPPGLQGLISGLLHKLSEHPLCFCSSCVST